MDKTETKFKRLRAKNGQQIHVVCVGCKDGNPSTKQSKSDKRRNREKELSSSNKTRFKRLTDRKRRKSHMSNLDWEAERPPPYRKHPHVEFGLETRKTTHMQEPELWQQKISGKKGASFANQLY
jgi:hypothetical protein